MIWKKIFLYIKHCVAKKSLLNFSFDLKHLLLRKHFYRQSLFLPKLIELKQFIYQFILQVMQSMRKFKLFCSEKSKFGQKIKWRWSRTGALESLTNLGPLQGLVDMSDEETWMTEFERKQKHFNLNPKVTLSCCTSMQIFSTIIIRELTQKRKLLMKYSFCAFIFFFSTYCPIHLPRICEVFICDCDRVPRNFWRNILKIKNNIRYQVAVLINQSALPKLLKF